MYISRLKIKRVLTVLFNLISTQIIIKVAEISCKLFATSSFLPQSLPGTLLLSRRVLALENRSLRVDLLENRWLEKFSAGLGLRLGLLQLEPFCQVYRFWLHHGVELLCLLVVLGNTSAFPTQFIRF